MKKLLFLSFITMISSVLYAQDKPDSLLFSDAIEMAQHTLDSLELNATLIGGAVFYHSDYHDDYHDDDETIHSDSTTIGRSLNSLSLIVGEHEGDSLQPVHKAPMNPTGYSNLWEIYAYASEVDSLLYMEVNSEGVIYSEFYAAEEEELDFAILKPIPQEYIDSDSAAVIAEMLGGREFREEYSDTSGSFSFWDMQLTALHDYEAFPDQNPADVPVMWVASYYGVSMDHMGKAIAEEYTIYMDITSGDTLFTERMRIDEEPPHKPEPQSIVFSDAVYLAQQALDSMGVSAMIMGGGTYYGSEDDDYGDDDYGDDDYGDDGYSSNSTMWSGGRTPNFTGLSSQFRLVGTEHEDDSLGHGSGPGDDWPMIPNGYAPMWEVYAYEANLDSMILMAVSADGVMYYELFGEDDVEEEVDFSLMKPLPDDYVDSDSAVAIAEEIGGKLFREMYSESPERYAFWDMGLQAIHEYWAFLDENPADVPVMWSVSYYGIAADLSGNITAEEFVIYLDIATGDTIFTERYVEDLTPEPNGIVFSDAVYLAQQALDSMGVSAMIMGGGTYYGSEDDDYGDDDYGDDDYGDDDYGDDGYSSNSTMWSGGRTPNFTGLSSQFRLVGTEHEDDSLGHGSGPGDDWPMIPNGYAPMWEVYAYEANLDSMILMAVSADGVMYYELFGEDDVEEEVDFSLMKPLPDDYVDSDELFTMIFNQASLSMDDITTLLLPEIPAGINVVMDMELSILHNYWSLPIDLAPELIPVTWQMNMYASAMDSMGNVVMEDSLSMFMDVESGNLLYSSMDLTNSETERIEPVSITLHQNYPNPFNPTTSISFELNRAQNVSLIIYNMLGQEVMTLVNDRMESGVHQITFDANKLASGVYLYRLITNQLSLTKKMTLIK